MIMFLGRCEDACTANFKASSLFSMKSSAGDDVFGSLLIYGPSSTAK